jgi:hypothetical protein
VQTRHGSYIDALNRLVKSIRTGCIIEKCRELRLFGGVNLTGVLLVDEAANLVSGPAGIRFSTCHLYGVDTCQLPGFGAAHPESQLKPVALDSNPIE